jgi:hypothetical protein
MLVMTLDAHAPTFAGIVSAAGACAAAVTRTNTLAALKPLTPAIFTP